MFYERLKAICDSRNITITSAVRAIDGSIGSIDGWKKGRTPISDVVYRLALHLDTSADYLLGLTEDPSPATEREFLLTDQEKGLVNRIRLANEPIRSMVFNMVEAALTTAKDTNSLKATVFSSPKDEQVSHDHSEESGFKRIEGKAAAGLPINTVPDLETRVSVPAKYLTDNYFIVQAQGDSMIDANIDDGDYCVFQKDAYLDEGRVMLVQVEGSTDVPDATIKRVYRRGNRIELHSANSKYEPMIYPADTVRLMGVLVEIMVPDI